MMTNMHQWVSSPSGGAQAQPGEPTVTIVRQPMPNGAHRAVSNVQAGEADADSLAQAPAASLPEGALFPGLEVVEGYRPHFRSEVSTLVEERGEESAEQAAEADFRGAPDAIFASRALVIEEYALSLPEILASIPAVMSGVQTGVRAVRGARERRETAGITPEPSTLLEVVIGEDDRTRIPNTDAAPWNGICQLNIRAADGGAYRGTGWLIGPRCVVTAGHCLYMHDAGGWASSISVAPGRDGNKQPFGSTQSKRFASTAGWVKSRNRDNDYGVIILPSAFSPVSGTTPYQFAYANLGDTELKNRLLNCSGYSADSPPGKDGTKQWFHARRATQLAAQVITYDIDTGGGASGCPVFIVNSTTGARTCVGIHTTGSNIGNSATRIIPQIAANLDRWRQASEKTRETTSGGPGGSDRETTGGGPRRSDWS